MKRKYAATIITAAICGLPWLPMLVGLEYPWSRSANAFAINGAFAVVGFAVLCVLWRPAFARRSLFAKWAVRVAVLYFPAALLYALVNDRSADSRFSVATGGPGEAIIVGGGVAPDSWAQLIALKPCYVFFNCVKPLRLYARETVTGLEAVDDRHVRVRYVSKGQAHDEVLSVD